jgi:hypothetical protein
MKEFFKQNKFLIALIIILFIVNLLLNIFFVALGVSHSLNSDFVANFLTYHDTFRGLIYLPTDNYLYQYLYYLPILKIFGFTPLTTFFTNLIDTIFCFLFFILFYAKFTNKKEERTNRIIPLLTFILPLFLLINQSMLFFVNLSRPFNRTMGLGLVFAFLYFLNLKKKVNFFWLALAFVLLVSLFLGDPLFVYVFALPLILAYLITSFRSNLERKFGLKIILFLTIAIIASIGLKYLLNKSGYFIIYGNDANFVSLDGLGYNLKIFTECFLKLFNSFFFGGKVIAKSTILYLSNLLLLISGIYGLYLLFKKELAKNNALGIFIPLSFILTIFAFVFSNKPSGDVTVRFLLILPFLFVIGLFTFISEVVAKKKKYLIAFLLFMSFAVLLNVYSLRSIYRYQPTKSAYETNYQLFNFMKKEGLEYGYAIYWQASLYTFLSEDKIKIRQVDCIENRILPFPWIASEDFFKPESFTGKTFLIVDNNNGYGNCSYKEITDQFGFPEKKLKFESNGQKINLIVFDYNIASKF